MDPMMARMRWNVRAWFKGGRRWGLLLFVALAGALGASRLAGGMDDLDVDAGTGLSRLPRLYLNERFVVLEKEVARLQSAQQEEVDPYQALALAASVKVRLVAMELLASTDDHADTSLTALYGMTIGNAAEAFDGLFQTLPRLAQEMAGGVSSDRESVENMATIVKVMQDFVQSEHAVPKGFDATDPAAVEMHVYRLFSPLSGVLEPAGLPGPRSTWSVQPGLWEAASQWDLSRIDEVVEQARSLSETSKSRALLLEILRLLRSGKRFPDLRPRVDQCFGLMTRQVHWLELVEATQWLTATDHERLDQLLANELEQYKNQGLRPVVLTRLERLLAIEPLLGRLGRFHGDGARGAVLEALFSKAVASCVDPAAVEEALAALGWLNEVAGEMGAIRDIRDDNLTPEAHRAFVFLRGEYDRFESQVLEQARAVTGNLGLVYHPSTSAMAQVLGQWRQDMVNLTLLSSALDSAAAANPRSALGINQRMKRNIDALAGDPVARQSAAAELTQWGRQVHRFTELPGEARLRGRGDKGNGAGGYAWLGPNVAGKLLESIDERRVAWVTAWASGQPAAVAERELAGVERLMRWIYYVGTMVNVPRDVAILNRWTGWEVEPKAMARWVEDLRGQLSVLARLPGAGKLTELERSLDEMEGIEGDNPRCAGVLLVVLYARLGEGLSGLPSGASGALSQLLYPPDSTAYLAGQWQQFAVLSRYFNELSIPRGQGEYWSPGVRQQCVVMTRQLLESEAGLESGATPPASADK